MNAAAGSQTKLLGLYGSWKRVINCAQSAITCKIFVWNLSISKGTTYPGDHCFLKLIWKLNKSRIPSWRCVTITNTTLNWRGASADLLWSKNKMSLMQGPDETTSSKENPVFANAYIHYWVTRLDRETVDETKMVSRPFWDQNVTLYRVTRLVSRPFPRPKCLDSSLETSFDTKMPNSAIHPVFKSFLLLTD